MNTKTKKILGVILALAVCAGILIYPLLTIKDSEFGGADGAADEIITSIDTEYEPWFEPMWAPPGGETESLLFCLQAALGSGVFFFCIGYLTASKKYKKKDQ
ncbi:cobalt/nickel transport protein [Hydrogenoanaerobacterium saccharovorans]|uniref:Cobalt transport protein CbiN n=1 Tax=Hydrogenoanaerobacterium saccharovorans TaxID=474960 RepID=A0A1H8A6R7_9FIRM|nr:energy-coupling factor ABC transporter substrate-binding protein [Hydrogenoanaerobacterium saccharovorans]RPF48172.1 cobalt/nickel transport protein [Hydrogenoanaerobacterium saccharovorans]SEM65508.1 cobalt/nickel transport protein [Hydrogenoanaerobacterium saccharovorans]